MSGRRRDRSRSGTRSASPSRRRRRRRRSRSSSEDSTRHRKSRHYRSDRSSGRSRGRERYRSRSRSRSTERRKRKDKKHGRHSSSRSRSRERKKSNKSEKKSDQKQENPAAALKARVKALLEKSGGTSEAPAQVEEVTVALPTPGQLSVIESETFSAAKFVSKRSSKKWDVPPSEVTKKKLVPAEKSFDVTEVDPSEFVPKVVPLFEVEGALGRGEGVEMGGGEDVSIESQSASVTAEAKTQPIDRKERWLQKLKKMRENVS